MTRIAIISDIHANMPALNAVLSDIEGRQVDAIYCLGDIAGYGPQPIEAVDKIMDVCAPGKCLTGNHDHAVLKEPIGFNRSAREAILWHAEVLKPRWYHFGQTRKRWRWLSKLPTSFTEGDVLFVHASPRQPLEEYVLEEHTKGLSLTGEDPQTLLQENFDLVEHVCFIGHTHRPGVVTGDDLAWHSLADIDNKWTVDERKVIVNIGSVGQPRDNDPRACYAIFDGETVRWHRVEYDIEKVRKMIQDNPRLENRLGDRLQAGK